MSKKSNTIEFTTSWCVQDVRNELAKEVADMTDEEIYEELERLYKRFKENAMESGWDVIDSCFDTKPKEKEKTMDVDTDYRCDACEELAMSMGNPCQCLSCDPDGTRYICTCDEDNEESGVVCDICDGKGYLTDVYDTEAEETQTQRCDSCKEFVSDKQAQEHVESEVA